MRTGYPSPRKIHAAQSPFAALDVPGTRRYVCIWCPWPHARLEVYEPTAPLPHEVGTPGARATEAVNG